MGGIGSGTKSIKRLRRGKICDYEHQNNKSITFFSSKKGKQIKKKETLQGTNKTKQGNKSDGKSRSGEIKVKIFVKK